MNWGYLTLIAVAFSVLLILSQRIVPRHKGTFRGFIVSIAILLMIRYEFQTENIIGYLLALITSFLYWLLIGRYNQISTAQEDSIRVYGLDD